MKLDIKVSCSIQTVTSKDGKEVEVFNKTTGKLLTEGKDYFVTDKENVDEIELSFPSGMVYLNKWKKS